MERERVGKTRVDRTPKSADHHPRITRRYRCSSWRSTPTPCDPSQHRSASGCGGPLSVITTDQTTRKTHESATVLRETTTACYQHPIRFPCLREPLQVNKPSTCLNADSEHCDGLAGHRKTASTDHRADDEINRRKITRGSIRAHQTMTAGEHALRGFLLRPAEKE